MKCCSIIIQIRNKYLKIWYLKETFFIKIKYFICDKNFCSISLAVNESEQQASSAEKDSMIFYIIVPTIIICLDAAVLGIVLVLRKRKGSSV